MTIYTKAPFKHVTEFNNLPISDLFNTPEFAEAVNNLVPTPSSPSYNSYTALVTQSGTSNPVLEVLSDTIGITSIPFVRSSAGVYLAALGPASSCPLIVGRTVVLTNANGLFSGGPYIYGTSAFILFTGGPDTYLSFNFYAVDASGNHTPIDITGDPVYLEIRVYN